jgi:hypothetical protein
MDINKNAECTFYMHYHPENYLEVMVIRTEGGDMFMDVNFELRFAEDAEWLEKVEELINKLIIIKQERDGK